MEESVVCHDLSFAWPDGDVVLEHLTASFPAGLTGLVGLNGAGKSTLLRILAGQLAPTSGTFRIAGAVGYLPQDLALGATATIAQALGVADALAALVRVDVGRPELNDFDLLDDRWDIADRTAATLATFGFDADLDLDRRLDTLSGGEATLLAVAALLLKAPDVLLLDEPTNNLDTRARERLLSVLAGWTGPAIVVTHDRTLLDAVHHVAELRPPTQRTSAATVKLFGGNFTAYTQALAVEEEAARREVRAAESDLKRQQRELREMHTKLDRRQRTGRKAFESKRQPKIVMNALKRSAQVSAAKLAESQQGDVARANATLVEAQDRLREDDIIRIDLSQTELPRGRDVVITSDLVLRNGVRVELHLRGPERVGLTGRNGSGKTTLINTLAGSVPPRSGSARVLVPMRLLPQRMQLLDDAHRVLQAVRAVAPAADDHALRAQLAQFMLRGDDVHRPVGTLSGGERFRATLAALLLATPAPQLLIIDEPTNNLDLDSVSQLVTALTAYRGALLVASHDQPFLDEIGLDRTVDLDSAAGG